MLVESHARVLIAQVTQKRVDVGVKLKGVDPTKRLTPSAGWDSMVTDRIQIDDPMQIDKELAGWLRRACDAI